MPAVVKAFIVDLKQIIAGASVARTVSPEIGSAYPTPACRISRRRSAPAALWRVRCSATAARALSGGAVSVTKQRRVTQFGHRRGFITVHPSYLLRLPNEDDKVTEYHRFVPDLQQVRELVPPT